MIIIYVFLGIGIIFNLLGSVALLRFPDVYTRLHGATKCTTFGTMFLTLAVFTYGLWHGIQVGEGKYWTLAIHTFVALICLLLTNPTSAHAVAKASYKIGIKPKHAVVDKLEERR